MGDRCHRSMADKGFTKKIWQNLAGSVIGSMGAET